MKLPKPEALKLLHEGTLALAVVEHNGMRLDMDYLTHTTESVKSQIKEITDQLYDHKIWRVWKKIHGDRAKIGSTDQLVKVMFGHFKHPVLKFTDTGKPKTDEEALSYIRSKFVGLYLRKKKLEKVLSTYLKGFAREQVDGYLHPSFNFNPISYRSGCSEPNVQNIPSRGSLTKLVRDCFIPRKGRRLVEIDYSTLEVRVSACYHKDPAMIAYITDPSKDMHRDTAMDLFLLSIDQIEKKTTRDWTKNRFVFPQFYGSVFFQCAPNLWKGVLSGAVLPNGKTVKKHLEEKGIKELGEKASNYSSGRISTQAGTFMEHVRQVEEKLWYQRFPIYTEWKNRWWRDYCQTGSYEMLTGFVINGVYRRNAVLNYAIQGSSFHCLLWSLIQIQKYLTKHKLRTKIVNEIHDCILLDVPESELQDVIHLCRDVMIRRCMKHYPWLVVPLEVEVEVTPEGGTWFDKKLYIEKSGTWQLAA